jgi:hypothetical protein
MRGTLRNGLLAAVAGGLAAAGCGGDTSGPPTADEIVVFGYLYVGEPLDASRAIRVSRVQPIDDVYDPETAAVDGALVTLSVDGGVEESLEPVAPGAYADSTIVIRPRSTYRLRVEIPGDRVVTASTTTPPAISVTGGPPETPESVRHETLQDEYPVFVACDEPRQVLLTDVYCREEWQDAVFIYPIGPEDGPADYDEYGGDNDEPRHIFAYFEADDVIQEAGLYRIDFYGAMMAFYGEYDVLVSAIDANTYAWLYRDRPEENSGVQGGLGVFGSASRRAWRVTVTP